MPRATTSYWVVVTTDVISPVKSLPRAHCRTRFAATSSGPIGGPIIVRGREHNSPPQWIVAGRTTTRRGGAGGGRRPHAAAVPLARWGRAPLVRLEACEATCNE